MDAIKKIIGDIACKIKGVIPKGTTSKLPLDKIPFMKAVGGKGGAPAIEGSRKMKFPYTYSAKLAQFPWLFYVKNNWIWRYYVIAVVICIPLFSKMSGMANSPGNKQKWAEQLAKDKEEEEQHHH